MADQISLRRDTEANWIEADPVLAQGEHAITLDDLATEPKFKIGDGLSLWSELPYFGGTGGALPTGIYGQTLRYDINNELESHSRITSKEWVDAGTNYRQTFIGTADLNVENADNLTAYVTGGDSHQIYTTSRYSVEANDRTAQIGTLAYPSSSYATISNVKQVDNVMSEATIVVGDAWYDSHPEQNILLKSENISLLLYKHEFASIIGKYIRIKDETGRIEYVDIDVNGLPTATSEGDLIRWNGTNWVATDYIRIDNDGYIIVNNWAGTGDKHIGVGNDGVLKTMPNIQDGNADGDILVWNENLQEWRASGALPRRGLEVQSADLDLGALSDYPILRFTAKANKKYKLSYHVNLLHVSAANTGISLRILVGAGAGSETAFGTLTYSHTNVSTMQVAFAPGTQKKLRDYALADSWTTTMPNNLDGYEVHFVLDAILNNGATEQTVDLQITVNTVGTPLPDKIEANSWLQWEEF